jgi:putrescine transport system substrate-binding protein
MYKIKNYIFFIILFSFSAVVKVQECSANVKYSTNSDDTSKISWINWVDFTGKNTLVNFEKQYNIKTLYSVVDSNEVLEAKLLSGQSGADLVTPSQNFFIMLCKIGMFLKLDPSKLSNIKYVDQRIVEKINASMHGNSLDYGIPYLWGTTGIGYNKQLIEQALGAEAPTNSWALVFELANIKKLAKYGVAFIDDPNEIIGSLLAYMGVTNPKLADYEVAFDKLETIRPYITYFNSTRLVNELANGDICLAIGWSGDIQISKIRSANSSNILYSIPREGALMWVDMLAIPKKSKNQDKAYCLINYLLDPKVMADISSETKFAHANNSSLKYLNKEFANNEDIFISDDTLKRLFVANIPDKTIIRLINRRWVRLKAKNN